MCVQGEGSASREVDGSVSFTIMYTFFTFKHPLAISEKKKNQDT